MAERELCKLREVYRAIGEFELHFEQSYGLSFNEGLLLCSLSHEKQLTSGQLAEMMGLTHSNASKVIRSVERKNFIVRRSGDMDKRQMLFELTIAGEELIDSIKCTELSLPKILDDIVK